MTFVPLKNVPVGSDYILGPGDQLLINLWGSVQQDFTIDIDAEGAVMLPKIGKVTVAGMSLGRATQMITTLFERNFANFYLDITLGRLKTIEVYVLGDVTLPGRYNLSSLSTVLYALYSAGGPTKLGSLRSIQLIRDQHVYKIVDLYDLLLYGDKSSDIALKRGDTIFIPKVGETVAIQGEVKTPAIYEISDKTSLFDLVSMAGKYTRNTYIKEINLIRREPQSDSFQLKTLSYKNADDFSSQAKKVMVQEGDIIDLKAIDSKIFNWVAVTGSVKFRDRYDYKRAQNLDELIHLAGGIKDPTYLIEISRTNNMGIQEAQVVQADSSNWKSVILQPFDMVNVYSMFDLASIRNVKVFGAVKNTGEYRYAEGMTAAQLILKAGGLVPSSDITKVHIVQPGPDGKMKVSTLDMNDQLQVPLLPDAQVYVEEKSIQNIAGSVTVKGEVSIAGVFPIYENETFTSFIKRIGGFNVRAYIPGIALYRQYRDGQQFVDLSQETGISSSYMQAIVKLSNYNRLRVDFDRLYRYHEFEDAVVLKDNDVIDVPDMPTEIKVVGGVYNQGSFLYKEGEPLSYYLSRAGNFRRDADGSEMFVAHIDGTVSRTSDQGFLIKRGDSLIIPIHEVKETDWLKTLLDWSQVVFNLATVWKIVLN